jgi:hypothetical protein
LGRAERLQQKRAAVRVTLSTVATGGNNGEDTQPFCASQRPLSLPALVAAQEGTEEAWDTQLRRDGVRAEVFVYGDWAGRDWQTTGRAAARCAVALGWLERAEAQHGPRTALTLAQHAAAAAVRAGLGAAHALRLQALEATFRLLITCERFEEAAAIGRQVAEAHSRAYPAVWPVRGLHLASMARLFNFLAADERCVTAAQEAIKILAVTHGEGDVLRMTQAALQQSAHSLQPGRPAAAELMA